MLDAYTVRKAIPRLLLAVIAINLSIYLCIAALDITLVIGKGLNQLLTGPFVNDNSFEGVNINSDTTNNIAGVLASTGALAAIIGGLFATGVAGLAGIGNALAVLLPVILIVVAITLAVFFTLIIRQGLIIFLTVTSPIAFVLYILPGTEKYFKRWGDLFVRTLAVYPIIAAIFAMSNAMGAILLNSEQTQANGSSMLAANQVFAQASSGPAGTLQIVAAILVLYAPLVLIPFSFKLAGGALSAIMDATGSRARGMAGKWGDSIREKRKNDPYSWLNKSKVKAQEARNESHISGRAIKGGLRAGLRRDGTGLRGGFRTGAENAVSPFKKGRREELAKNALMASIDKNDTNLQAMENILKNGGGAKELQDYLMNDASLYKDEGGNLVDDATGKSFRTGELSNLDPADQRRVRRYKNDKKQLTDADGNVLDTEFNRQEAAKGADSIMQAMSLGTKQELRQYSAVQRASLGTDYAGDDGVGFMTKNIAEAFDEDTNGYAQGIVEARDKATQAKRGGDLSAPGTGSHIVMGIKMREAGYKKTDKFDGSTEGITDLAMEKGMLIKSPQELVGRGETQKAVARALKRQLRKSGGAAKETEDAYKEVGGDAAYKVTVDKLHNAVREHGPTSIEVDTALKATRSYETTKLKMDTTYNAHVKNMAAAHGTLEVIGRSSKEAQLNIGEPVMGDTTYIRQAVTREVERQDSGGKIVTVKEPVKIDGKVQYELKPIIVTKGMDGLRSNSIWRSTMREYGGAAEADIASQGRQAAESADEAAKKAADAAEAGGRP